MPGNAKRWRDFSQRRQYKGPFMQARMRQGQLRVLAEFLSVEQQIEIQSPWSVFHTTLAAKALFDRKQLIQQSRRWRDGEQFNHGIDKVRLMLQPHGCRPVQR